ncbi:hypothetical protein LZ554_008511 [Drepanopeziza brunnea f. sp. 'monogermtubi']|nr:hypothetical protein LZ554_008511 [Drepanopeziza brunnea f. sp. 'monogermtubi']
MGDGSPRALYKGPLLPPTRVACNTSYTQSPLESGKIGVKNERKDKVNVVEFSSTMRAGIPILVACSLVASHTRPFDQRVFITDINIQTGSRLSRLSRLSILSTANEPVRENI